MGAGQVAGQVAGQFAGQVVVHAGPTLSADEIRSALPAAEVRPPVARGDLFRETWSPGDRVVVIDGYFRERRSVGYQELLWLLGQGVDVVGAASMGALRAAELGAYGMRGVGEIHRMFASGEVDGDDEVSILHGPATKGYPPQTVALVNLRYGCREGAATGEIPEDAGRRVVAAASGLPFTHRTWRELADLLPAGDRPVLAVLERGIGTGRWDLKRLDALSALTSLAAAPGAEGSPGPAARSAPVAPAGLTRIGRDLLLARRARTEYAPGRWLSDLDVLDAARLFDDGYPAVHQEVLQDLLDSLAATAGRTPAAYARAKLGLAGEEDLPGRLASWLTDGELSRLGPGERLRLVMVRVWPVWLSLDWRPAMLERLRAAEGWRTWVEIVTAADEARELDGHRLVVPPPRVCGTLFTRHWPRNATSTAIELARRGFSGVDDLGRTAGRFFAYDLRRTRRGG